MSPKLAFSSAGLSNDFDEVHCVPCTANPGGLEDTGWTNIEDAPIAAEQGATGRTEHDDVVSTEGDAVVTPRRIPEPRKPVPDVVARHNLTNLPHASWCSHRVAARRTNNPLLQKENPFVA